MPLEFSGRVVSGNVKCVPPWQALYGECQHWSPTLIRCDRSFVMRCTVRICLLTAVFLGLLTWGAAPASAVILLDKPTRNVTPPKGSLLNSGWQWQGKWGPYLGTAISKFFFITAEHIGGNVGDSFVLNGKSYKAVATYDDPLSDLQM